MDQDNLKTSEQMEADALDEMDPDDMPETIKRAMKRFEAKGVANRFAELTKYLDSPECRKNDGTPDKQKIATALFKTFCLRQSPDSNNVTYDTNGTCPVEQGVYAEAISDFIKSMRFDSDRLLSHYACSGVRKNAYRIRMREFADQKTGGLFSRAALKDISQKKKALREKIKNLPLYEQQAELERFDRENYKTLDDTVFSSEDEEAGDKQLFQQEEFYDKLFYLDQYFLILTSYFLSFRNYRKNSTEPLLYPMWYAETVTRLMKEFDWTPDKSVQVLRVADNDYLAYFLEEPCSDNDSIRRIPYRLRRELFPDAEFGIRLSPNFDGWLEIKVPQGYLKPVRSMDAGGISRSRKQFRTDTKWIKEKLTG